MKCSGVLLAGGQSRRMGAAKADVLIGGIPLWERQTGILRACEVEEIFISGQKRQVWRDAGLAVVEDEDPAAGPLGGLISALRHSSHPRLLVLAVDLPAMTAEFLRRLLEEPAGVVPANAERYEPLAAIYPVAALDLAERRLRAGALSLQGFVAEAVREGFLRERMIEPSEQVLFFNVNTPADLAEFRERRAGLA